MLLFLKVGRIPSNMKLYSSTNIVYCWLKSNQTREITIAEGIKQLEKEKTFESGKRGAGKGFALVFTKCGVTTYRIKRNYKTGSVFYYDGKLEKCLLNDETKLVMFIPEGINPYNYF